jgi:hypothetical protein
MEKSPLTCAFGEREIRATPAAGMLGMTVQDVLNKPLEGAAKEACKPHFDGRVTGSGQHEKQAQNQ